MPSETDAHSHHTFNNTSPNTSRLLLPDILRGLSLVGILCVNMQDFARYHEWEQIGINEWAQRLIDLLFNGRFISLFAMLFGWGMAGWLERGVSRAVFVRRSAWLWLLGTLHAIFVWHGDILATYGLLAFFLIPLSRLSVKGLLYTAAGLGSWWIALMTLGYWGTLQDNHAANTSMTDTTHYFTLITDRWHNQINQINPLSDLLFNDSWILMLFCLGMVGKKIGLLEHPAKHKPMLRRLATWGIALGLTLGLWLGAVNRHGDEASVMLSIIVRMVGGLAGALGYVGLLTLWWERSQPVALAMLAPTGNIALSNYLAQSLLMTTLFYGYALGWSGWSAAACLALALAVGCVQIWLSKKMGGKGAMERLTRWVVYGRR